MVHVAFLSGVTPGPACVIPEDKKIFRVTVDDAAPADVCDVTCPPDARCADSAPPLPVPHMYSA